MLICLVNTGILGWIGL